MSFNKHLQECASESGIDLDEENAVSDEEKLEYNGHVIHSYYDEGSSSAFAWCAWCKGFGTFSELDREDAIDAMKAQIDAD
jgi:hypothetical protein